MRTIVAGQVAPRGATPGAHVTITMVSMSVHHVGLPMPRRVSLARVATPLQPLPRTSDALGVEVVVKRDDLTGVELSGNKVRKLEFLFAEAIDQRADVVITGGGEQSNHA